MKKTKKEEYPYYYAWSNTPERRAMFGRRCRIVNLLPGKRTATVEFEDTKEQKVVSLLPLRKTEPESRKRHPVVKAVRQIKRYLNIRRDVDEFTISFRIGETLRVKYIEGDCVMPSEDKPVRQIELYPTLKKEETK